MGTLRLVLALLVASGHLLTKSASPAWWTGTAAIFAVKAFFVISGFYMALVLDTRYRDKPARYFYASRALRLLPAYWFISAGTILAAWRLTGPGGRFYALPEPNLAWRHVDPRAFPLPLAAYLLVSLTTLLGADTWLWLGFNPISGHLSVAPGYAPGATSAS